MSVECNKTKNKYRISVTCSHFNCNEGATSFIDERPFCQTHALPVMEKILAATQTAFDGNITEQQHFNIPQIATEDSLKYLREKIERIPEFSETLKIMKAIMEKKNKDYASDTNPFSNFEFSAFIMKHFSGTNASFADLIGTKLARLSELLQEGRQPMNESIDDTFIDLAVYAVLWKCYVERSRRGLDNSKNHKTNLDDGNSMDRPSGSSGTGSANIRP